jgi:hypothetical protein
VLCAYSRLLVPALTVKQLLTSWSFSVMLSATLSLYQSVCVVPGTSNTPCEMQIVGCGCVECHTENNPYSTLSMHDVIHCILYITVLHLSAHTHYHRVVRMRVREWRVKDSLHITSTMRAAVSSSQYSHSLDTYRLYSSASGSAGVEIER